MWVCAQVLMGRKMEDWLRFSVCYWHSFCGTGTVTSPVLRSRFYPVDAHYSESFVWIIVSMWVLNYKMALLFLGADPFGFPTLHRSWNEGSPMESAKKRLRAAFEFFTKLGVRINTSFSQWWMLLMININYNMGLLCSQVKYYTFHDR